MRRRTAAVLLAVLLAGCRDRPPGLSATSRAGPRLRWSAKLAALASLESAPTLGSDGTVYVAGTVPAQAEPGGRPLPQGMRQACLYALDAAGTVTRALPGSLVRGGGRPLVLWTRVAPWGTVYAVDSEGGLYAMFADGRQRFRSAGQGLTGPPAIAGNGRLMVGSWRGLLGFDMEAEGEGPDWAFATSEYGGAPVLAEDGTVYAPMLRAVRAVDGFGDVRWSAPFGHAALIADGAGGLYLTEKNRLVALDGGGSVRWEYHADDDLGRPVLAGAGKVIAVGAGGLVHAVGPDGQRLWTHAMDSPAWSLPAAAADGSVYVSDRRSQVCAIGPGGTRRWSVGMNSACGAPAVADDGAVFVACQDGRLYALSPP